MKGFAMGERPWDSFIADFCVLGRPECVDGVSMSSNIHTHIYVVGNTGMCVEGGVLLIDGFLSACELGCST